MTNKVCLEGPIYSLFCPVCCNSIRFDSAYGLRTHLKQNHIKGMQDPYWKVTKDFINGNDIKSFYNQIDEVTETIREIDQ